MESPRPDLARHGPHRNLLICRVIKISVLAQCQNKVTVAVSFPSTPHIRGRYFQTIICHPPASPVLSLSILATSGRHKPVSCCRGFCRGTGEDEYGESASREFSPDPLHWSVTQGTIDMTMSHAPHVRRWGDAGLSFREGGRRAPFSCYGAKDRLDY